MVVYYIKKAGENVADYRYPIKEGDICMLYDGEVIKTVYIDGELDPNSIWRDFKFIDTKSLKSYQFPTSDSILCAPVGDKHAIGDTGLLTQLIKECKGEWLLDFLNETSAVLSGFVDYWDLGILSRFIGDNNLDVAYENEETLTEFLEKPEENENVYEYDDEEDVDDADILPKSYDIKWFCLSVLSCIEGQINKRSYQILYDILNGATRSEIADRNHLTQERIRQIVVKTTKQVKELLIEQRKALEETKAKNAQLNAQIKLLKEDVAGLKALLPKDVIIGKDTSEDIINIEIAELLDTSVRHINLPVRALNVLDALGVKKFSDIPLIGSYMQILKVRNGGKKTVHDISQMLGDFDLDFGMSFTGIVEVLGANDWKNAKRKWIKASDNRGSQNIDSSTGTITKSEDNTDEESLNVTEESVSDTILKKDETKENINRIWTKEEERLMVRYYQQGVKIKKIADNFGRSIAEIVEHLYQLGLKIEEKGGSIDHSGKVEEAKPEEATILLTSDIIEAARTPNGGFTKSQLAAIGIDWPPPEDWIEEKVGTMITPSQLENFNRIEYVAKTSQSSYKVAGSETYKDVAFGLDDRRKMEAILQAMTHFYTPATPYDIARTISRSAWGDEAISEDTVDSILKRLPEVDYIKWGKYILKSRNKK